MNTKCRFSIRIQDSQQPKIYILPAGGSSAGLWTCMWVFCQNTVVKYIPLRIRSQRMNWSAFANIWIATWNSDPGFAAASTTRIIRSTRGRVSIPNSFPRQRTKTFQSTQSFNPIKTNQNQNTTSTKTSKTIANVVLEKRRVWLMGCMGIGREGKKEPDGVRRCQREDKL